MRNISKAVGIIILLALAAGCQDKVAEQNQQLYQQNHELQDRLNEANAKLAGAPDAGSLAAMQQQLSLKDQQILQLQAQPAATKTVYVNTPAGKTPGMEGVATTYDAAAGTVTATIPGDVLFAPGKSEVKESSKATLDKIVHAIEKQYPGKRLYIDGHTDSDPITKTKDQWDDNWDLSYARAKAVTAYLINNGVDSKLIVVRSYGQNNPKATKEASRRVEIVVSTR